MLNAMRFRVARPLLSVLSVVAISCAQAQGFECTETTGLVNKGGAQLQTQISSGGYLSIQSFANSEQALTNKSGLVQLSRCTAKIFFAENEFSAKVKILTARHCIRHETFSKLSFDFYDTTETAKGYVTLDLEVPMLQSLTSLRNSELPASLRKDLAQLYKKLPDLNTNPTQETATRPLAPEIFPERVFATFVEMELIDAQISKASFEANKGALKLVFDGEQKVKSLASHSNADKVFLKEWQSVQSELEDMKSIEGTIALVGKMEKCKKGDAESKNSEVCTHLDALKVLLQKHLLPRQQKFLQGLMTSEELKIRRDEAIARRKQVWKSIQPLLRERPELLTIAGNFHFSEQDGKQNPNVLGFFGIRGDVLGKGSEAFRDFKDNGFYYDQTQKNVNIRFSAGDSGTAFLYGGVVPLAVVATVDNEATSGGAVLRPLPKKTLPSEKPTRDPKPKTDADHDPCRTN